MYKPKKDWKWYACLLVGKVFWFFSDWAGYDVQHESDGVPVHVTRENARGKVAGWIDPLYYKLEGMLD